MMPNQDPPVLHPAATAGVTLDNLHDLTLFDGLPVERGGKQLRYKQVRLRAVGVKDNRWAVRAAERVAMIGKEPALLMSQPEFMLGLTARHIEKIYAPGQPEITTDEITLDLMGELSTHDLMLIEQRSYLVEIAEQRRYGLLTDAQFNALILGTGPKETTSPLPAGAAATAGADAAAPGAGPQMLSELTR